MTNISTTNLPSGLTNAPLGTVLSTFGDNDPTIFHTYFNDFNTYEAGDWTFTVVGTTPTASIIAGDGGLLSIINSAANNDLGSLQLKAATFALIAGNQAWFKARLNISNATNAALVLGLIQTTTTPLTVTDGLYFSKVAASTTLNIIATKSSTSTTAAVATLANTTSVDVGWWYDGNATITAYLNGVSAGSIATTNMPTANLNLTIAVANGTAAANTLNVDYVVAATERPVAAAL